MNDVNDDNGVDNVFRKGKVLKSMTMPYKTATLLEQLAKTACVKQRDILKGALYELSKKEPEELNKLFIEYEVY